MMDDCFLFGVPGLILSIFVQWYTQKACIDERF